MDNDNLISNEDKYQTEDLLYRQDQIFERLCTKQELEQQAFLDEDKCYISNCQKKLGYMNKHQCKFCGHQVCEKHGFKHRPNPQDETQFKRICVLCENKYLKRLMNQPYVDEKKKLEDQLNQIDLKIQQKQKDKKEQLNYYESQKRDQQSSSSKNLTIQKLKEQKQRQVTNNQQDIDQLKQELEEIQKKTIDLERQNQETKKEIQNQKQQYQDQELKKKKLNQAIQAVELDTEATKKAVQKIENKILKNNYYLEEREVIKKQKEKQKQNEQGQSPGLFTPYSKNYNKNTNNLYEDSSNLQGFKDSMIDNSSSLQSSVYYKEPEIYETENGKKNKKNKKQKKKKKNRDREGNCGIDKCNIF